LVVIAAVEMNVVEVGDRVAVAEEKNVGVIGDVVLLLLLALILL
jgi:hypothetical protein